MTTTGVTVSQPIGVAIDPTSGRIYWGNTGGVTKVSDANLDGTGGGATTGSAVIDTQLGISWMRVGPERRRLAVDEQREVCAILFVGGISHRLTEPNG